LADSTSQINGNLAVKQLSKGMVTFVFDDANPSIYTAAYPVFTAKNLKACLAYPVSVFWNQNGITLKQSYEMQDAGWEIMSHTVTHTSIDDSFTQEKIRYDLVDSKRFLNRYKLNAKQFVAPNSAYPNGTMAPYFNDLLAKNYDCAYLDGTNFNDPAYANNANPINIYKIKRANMQNATLAQLKAAVDYAETNKTWLVFYEHQIDVNGYTTSQTLSDLLDYIKTKNIDVVTGTEAISKISTKLVAKENPATINQRVMEVEARTGTENLLTNPKFLGTTKPVGWTYNDATVTGGKTPSIVAHVPANSFQVALDGTNTGTNEYVQLYQDFPLSALIEPTPFVFSVYAKLLSGSNATMKLTVVPMVTGSQWSSHLESTTFNLSSTNMRYELPVLIPNFYAPVDNLRVYIQLYNNAANNAVTFSIDRPKLEIGVKATTWSQGKQLTDYFSAKLGASQSLTGATYTKIAFNANTLNLNGSWDDVNGKFTAFLKGLYQFNLQIAITAGVEGGRIILLLYKNGASYRTVNFAESGTGVQGAVLTCIADAVPGDYFEGYVWVSSAQSLTGGACFFDGNLISQS
jgi:peptidoglycan/xylan/chitin deacetylase (PgdA/CDA1 family)